jgi:hypothetical protein
LKNVKNIKQKEENKIKWKNGGPARNAHVEGVRRDATDAPVDVYHPPSALA